MSETYPGQMLPELQEKTTVDSNDLFYMVSSNASKKIKGSNLKDQMKPSDYTGATSSTNGANGLVPQPTTSDVDRFLKGDGTWGDISYAVGEASGSIASFSDGSALPMRSLKAYIEPVQSGSGEPSPSNIRPISGWTACNVVISGENLFEELGQGYINENGDYVSFPGFICTPYITVTPNEAYLLAYNRIEGVSLNGMRIAWYDINKTFIRRDGTLETTTNGGKFTSATAPSNAYYCRCSLISNQEKYTLTRGDISNTTYTIQFTDGSNPLTVYGGYVDIVSGLLVVDKLSVLISDLTLTRPANRVGYRTVSRDFINTIKRAVDNDDVVDISCDLYKKDSVANIYNGSMGIGVNPSGEIWMMCPNDITSADDFKTIYGAYRIVYPLATPQTYQLTPTQVKSLLGENNVWADTGDVDVHYVRDLTITIDDILSRLEALEG